MGLVGMAARMACRHVRGAVGVFCKRKAMMKNESEAHSAEWKGVSPREFFLEFPLYRKFFFDASNNHHRRTVEDIIDFRGTLDCYCAGCNEVPPIFWTVAK